MHFYKNDSNCFLLYKYYHICDCRFLKQFDERYQMDNQNSYVEENNIMMVKAKNDRFTTNAYKTLQKKQKKTPGVIGDLSDVHD